MVANIGRISKSGTGLILGAGAGTSRSLTKVASNLDTISPGMGSVVKTVKPLQQPRLKSLAKANKTKAAAVVAALLAGGAITMEAVEELSNDSDVSIAEFGRELLSSLGGVFSPDDDEGDFDVDHPYQAEHPEMYVEEDDDKVGQESVANIAHSMSLVDAATSIYQSACSAVGGVARLEKLDAWNAMDEDLKDLVRMRAR